jgi:hypothetical protein
MKLYPFTCFIFDDVGLISEDSPNTYRCPILFGGITAFNTEDFLGANGYPNVYWGWGREDDDMY